MSVRSTADPALGVEPLLPEAAESRKERDVMARMASQLLAGSGLQGRLCRMVTRRHGSLAQIESMPTTVLAAQLGNAFLATQPLKYDADLFLS